MPSRKSAAIKTTAAKSGKRTTKAVKSEPVVAEPVVEVAPAVVEATATETETETVSLNEEFTGLLTEFSTMRTRMTQLASRVRTLQKRVDRELRTAQKASKRRAKKTGNRQPSGFVKPTNISSELATFLGKPKDTLMARTEVTREINAYIREHKLQDPENGRRILPDAKLRKLLGVKTSEELTYFNLQSYMKGHFPSAASQQVSA